MVCLLLAVLVAQAQPPAPQRTIWELEVNQVAHDDVTLIVADDDVWVPVVALDRAGLQGIAGRRETRFGEAHVLLSSLAPDLTYELDREQIRLRIAAAARLFAPVTIDLVPDRPPGLTYGRSPSAFLNYGATWLRDEGMTYAAELGASLGPVAFITGATVDVDGRVLPGLSSITLDQRQSRRRWVAGDTFDATPTALGTRPVLLGLRVSRDYSLDPYYKAYANPRVGGSATLPSRAEIYVNGRLARQIALAPGPFQIERLPITTGLGNVKVVIRDPFGRQQELGGTFYLAQDVLKAGEQDYSYVAGVRRWDEIDGPSYHDPAATALHRFGWTDSFTIGGQIEGGKVDGGTVVNGGPIVNLRLWRLGSLEWAGQASRRDGQTGQAHAMTYQFSSRRLGIIATGRYLSPTYATVDLAPGDSRDSLNGRTQVDFPIGSFLHAGGGWFRDSEPAVDSASFSAPTAPSPRLGLASQSQSATEFTRGWFVQATVRITSFAQLMFEARRVRDTGDDARRWEGLVNLSVILGARSSATASASQIDGDSAVGAAVQRSLPVASGYGFRFGTDDAQNKTGYALLEGQNRYGYGAARYDQTSSTTSSLSVDVSGGLALIGRRLLLERGLDSSYALVQVPGARGVRVRANNQVAGRTNRWGDLLVPDLLAYQASTFSIDDEDIPVDYDLDRTSLMTAPPYRGGAIVRFEGRRIRAFRGRILMRTEAGERPPAFGTLTVAVPGGEVTSPIGSDGDFYLENIPAGRYTASVLAEIGQCALTVTIPEPKQLVTLLGDLRCDAAPK